MAATPRTSKVTTATVAKAAKLAAATQQDSTLGWVKNRFGSFRNSGSPKKKRLLLYHP
jgi:hypothetical protein